MKNVNFDEIQKYYNEGHSWKKCSKEFHISTWEIHGYIKGNLLKSRTLSESSKLYNNSEIGKKNLKSMWTDELKKKQSELKKELYKKYPEKHPNFKLSKNLENMSYPEKLAYHYLKENNIKFVSQKYIQPYWVDFYLEDFKLILEIDGSRWHQNKEKEYTRDSYIENKTEFKIIRIPANTTIANLEKIFNIRTKLDIDFIKKEIISTKREKKIYMCQCGNHKSNQSIKCHNCIKEENLDIKNSLGNVSLTREKIQHLDRIKYKFLINKEELEELVKHNHITQIGRKYGVSDNAIRKRCIILGINFPKRGRGNRKIN